MDATMKPSTTLPNKYILLCHSVQQVHVNDKIVFFGRAGIGFGRAKIGFGRAKIG